jgi:hypothetical protein
MLQRHINTKHDDKKLCDICSERFQSAEEIVNHKLSRHTISHTVPYANNITVDTHDCELCGFKYTTDIKMRTHKICKHDFKICHICEQTFSDTEQFKKHFEKNYVDPDDLDLLAQVSHYLE